MTWSHFLPLFLFIQKDMFFIIISLFSQENYRMGFGSVLFLPIYCITTCAPKYLREKAYGGTVHDK